MESHYKDAFRITLDWGGTWPIYEYTRTIYIYLLVKQIRSIEAALIFKSYCLLWNKSYNIDLLVLVDRDIYVYGICFDYDWRL